jgi:hypothetical protein
MAHQEGGELPVITRLPSTREDSLDDGGRGLLRGRHTIRSMADVGGSGRVMGVFGAKCWRVLARAWSVSLALLIACVTAIACANTDDDLFEGACRSDSDCQNSGLVCWQQKVCVAAVVPETPVVLRLQPPKSTGLLAEPFKVKLDATTQKEPIKLALTQPAVVRGTVSQAGNPLQPSIPGTLIATAPGGVEGHDLSFRADSNATLKPDGQGVLHGFELRVQPGHTYDIAFWPASPEIPPHYAAITVGGSLAGWKIELPDAKLLDVVEGRIVQGGAGVGQLRVWLQDAQERLCSTEATTDAEGNFALQVDPSTPEATLRFEPADSAEPLPRGRFAKPVKLPLAKQSKPVDLGIVELPAVPQKKAMAAVVRDDKGQPVPGALVRIQRWLPLPDDSVLESLYVEQHGLTDAKGRFVTELPPGPASMVVVPGPKSLVGRWTWKGELKSGDWPIQCPARPVLDGLVSDYRGKPVVGAKVQLRRLDPVAGEVTVPGSGDLGGDEPIEAATASSGQFSARLDAGQYAVWVLPPDGSGLARVLAKVADVRADQKAELLRVELPPPMMLAGRVLGPDGQPVPDVVVDVLAEKGAAALQQSERRKAQAGRKPGGDGNKPAKNDANRPAAGVLLESHLLASTVSNSEGRFEALVAPGQVAK